MKRYLRIIAAIMPFILWFIAITKYANQRLIIDIKWYIIALISTFISDIFSIEKYRDNIRKYIRTFIKPIITEIILIGLVIETYGYRDIIANKAAKTTIQYLLPIPIIIIIINIAYYVFYRICKRIDDKDK